MVLYDGTWNTNKVVGIGGKGKEGGGREEDMYESVFYWNQLFLYLGLAFWVDMGVWKRAFTLSTLMLPSLRECQMYSDGLEDTEKRSVLL